MCILILRVPPSSYRTATPLPYPTRVRSRAKRTAADGDGLRKPQQLQLQALARAAVAPPHVQRKQHQPCRAGFDGVAGARGGVDVGIDAQVPAVAAVLELAVAVPRAERLADADLEIGRAHV